jgi:hypothetical protein
MSRFVVAYSTDTCNNNKGAAVIRNGILVIGVLVSQAINATEATLSPQDFMATHLEVLADECWLGLIDLRAAVRNDNSTEIYFAQSDKAKECVGSKLAKGKDLLRNAISKSPLSKTLLVDVYAHWLTYMRSLEKFEDEAAQTAAEEEFKKSVDAMRAALDAGV